MRDTIAEHGPDAVALYLATGMAYDAGGQIAAGSLLGALGSRSFYTAVTVDNAPVLVAAELVTGNAMMNPLWDPTSPGLLMLVGTNPVVSHGYGTTLPDPINYLREFRAVGGRVWVLDPRRTESAAFGRRARGQPTRIRRDGARGGRGAVSSSVVLTPPSWSSTAPPVTSRCSGLRSRRSPSPAPRRPPTWIRQPSNASSTKCGVTRVASRSCAVPVR